jgi:DNA topoisomerase-1
VRLIIVESPKKARTLASFAGAGYRVVATMGHVRDLPTKGLGLEIGDQIVPQYEVIARARRTVSEIRAAARGAEAILLATDPDREGEAIAWHVSEAAGLPPTRTSRIAFHEISDRALRAALARPRRIDAHLVDAQQARRVLDRLVGYGLSPLLWRAIQRGTSAGRVQSVALRIVVDREREVRAFVPEEFWTVDVALSTVASGGIDVEEQFVARLIQIGETPPKIGAEAHARLIVAALEEALYRAVALGSEVTSRPPPPPFTTSTLQQVASSRLRLPAKRTMQIAQSLYESGLITYMRTDSVAVAPEVVRAVRAVIASDFGACALPASPRHFRTHARNAQEAHEAIRPVDPSKRPSMVSALARGDEGRLYSLIWSRTVASQMAAAQLRTDRATIEALCLKPVPTDPIDERVTATRMVLEARATAVVSPGWLAVYGGEVAQRSLPSSSKHTKDDITEAFDGSAETGELPSNVSLPELTPGAVLAVQSISPTQRFTRPPPRFTEATLVRALEAAGVGRPSTYATILSVIEERGYVGQANRAFVPTTLGLAVNDYLALRFPDVVDVQFTADMELRLDDVAAGGLDWQAMLGEFSVRFAQAITRASTAVTTDKLAIARTAADATVAAMGDHRKGGEVTGSTRHPARTSSNAGMSDATSVSVENAGSRSSRTVRRVSNPSDVVAVSPSPGLQSGVTDGTSAGEATMECLACGKPMVLRRSKFGAFWGCSGYPVCRAIHREGVDETATARPDGSANPKNRRFSSTTGRRRRATSEGNTEAPRVASSDASVGSTTGGNVDGDAPTTCTRCGKPMVARRSQFGEFWGCSGYPACREIRSVVERADPTGADRPPKPTRPRRTSAPSQAGRPDPMTARVIRARGTYRRPGSFAP